jgi:hypothetical protein
MISVPQLTLKPRISHLLALTTVFDSVSTVVSGLFLSMPTISDMTTALARVLWAEMYSRVTKGGVTSTFWGIQTNIGTAICKHLCGALENESIGI